MVDPRDCIFCQILAGNAPWVPVAETEGAAAFMDIFPVARGHTLVIPRSHAESIFEIDDDDVRAVAALSRRVAHALRAELEPDGLAVYQANGVAAGQTVWHYHVHLMPRNQGESMQLHGRKRADDAELEAVAAALRARLED